MKIYNRLNEFLKDKFSERTLKICIDGGFTCPNRDGTKGVGGCIFCSELGSGDHLKRLPIKEQVENYFKSYRSSRANKFIAYFQNFTSTYSDVQTLKRKYDEALIDERIVALDIDTRPDCISKDVCELLSSYKDKYYVYVELGLQSSNEFTHSFINQNIVNEEFIRAIKLLNEYKIDVVVHVMVGLPYETHVDIENTIKFINQFNIQGIKIHSTYIVKDTILEKLYLEGKYVPLELDEYISEVIYILTHINKDIIIHRISGDAPKDKLVAPEWNLHKKWVLNKVNNIMEENNLYQGMYFNEK